MQNHMEVVKVKHDTNSKTNAKHMCHHTTLGEILKDKKKTANTAKVIYITYA